MKLTLPLSVRPAGHKTADQILLVVDADDKPVVTLLLHGESPAYEALMEKAAMLIVDGINEGAV